MEFKLRISTRDKDMSFHLSKIIDNINRIMQEKGCIFYEIAYKPSEYVIAVSASKELKDFISDLVPEGWNYTYDYEYPGKYDEDLYD